MDDNFIARRRGDVVMMAMGARRGLGIAHAGEGRAGSKGENEKTDAHNGLLMRT